MIWKTTNRTHDQNEVDLVNVSKQAYFSDRGYVAGFTHTYKLRGVLQAASQAALTTAINALEQAYAYGGYDAGMYLDDGVTLTSHYLTNSLTAGGVKCLDISYPNGPAEYTTYRTYEITLQADFPIGTNALRDFNETVSFEGNGGPRKVLIETLDGYVVEQIVSQRTAYRAVQSGSMQSYGGYPNPPAPIWPGAELVDQRRISPISPQVEGKSRTIYGAQWQYVFQSAYPLAGLPSTV